MSKKNILIVEDDQFFRELLKKKLTSVGFSIIEASNGEDGIEKVKSKKPDLIILDLLLPNIDGFEVLSKVKTSSDTSSTPVIIVSNLGQQEDIEKGMKLGANDYLIKSQFDIESIVSKINNILK
ncbi:MAG: response regulator [Candidatus Staskawiczbacteria bacterium]|nr:response regulator [Candidatus Staskawiczbacteria bacterium]